MMNIAIIGAGQIGSRHLQAMANLDSAARVQLVDPSEESLKTAQERFIQVLPKEKAGRIELVCHRSIADLIDPVDVAIVATCADIRAGVIKELTNKKKVNALILEKVLFQYVAEYFEIDELLKRVNIPTWVNCWMREKDFYKKLKTRMNPEEKIKMKVEGSLWGLGCNSIHFMDLFSYLTGYPDFSFTGCGLDKETIDSKRPGFKEFTGKLMGGNLAGDSLVLSCYQGKDPYKITIVNNSQEHEITYGGDHMLYKHRAGGNESVEKAMIPFQSQTTHLLIQDIIKNKKCDLPGYHDSMTLHLPLVKVLLEHLQNITGEKIEKCPIT